MSPYLEPESVSGNAVVPPSDGERFPRILGRYDAGVPGPTLVVTGGLHGNEPAGARAARAVVRILNEHRPPFRGRVVAVAGNLDALARNRRFVDRDLNRVWTEQGVRDLLAGDPANDDSEAREQRALLEILESERRDAVDHGLVVLDLHTTSGGGPPFSLMSDTLANRRVATALPVPVILGLEESIDGTLLEYATRHGDRALVVEGGQHTDPESMRNHEAVIWYALLAIGCIDRDACPDGRSQRVQLQRVSAGLPRFVEIRHRHAVAPEDGFRMEPGFQGMQRVEAGQILARDRNGEIRASESGRLLMPLYQKQGSDGFFLVRGVSPFWLGLSAFLRRLRLDVFLPLLPGVHRAPESEGPDALSVDRGVARWLVVEIFHLFGYRRRLERTDGYVFSRRSARRT